MASTPRLKLVESTFATVRLRSMVTKESGSRGGRDRDGVQADRGTAAARSSTMI